MKRLLTVGLLVTFLALSLALVFPATAHGQPLSLSWSYSSCPTVPSVRLGSSNNGQTTVLCLWGSGYQGLGDPGGPGNQSNVFNVAAFHTTAWIRYYDGSGGHNCALNWNTVSFSNVYVTQVDIGTTGGYPYC